MLSALGYERKLIAKTVTIQKSLREFVTCINSIAAVAGGIDSVAGCILDELPAPAWALYEIPLDAPLPIASSLQQSLICILAFSNSLLKRS